MFLFLQITGKESQWNLVLEHQTEGYIWPSDAVASEVPQQLKDRLQGIKQISVEKFQGLKQKIAETRKNILKDKSKYF